MRLLRVVAVALAVVFVAPTAASAARDATAAERAAIRASYDGAVQCFDVTISTVDERWAYASSGCPTPEDQCISECTDVFDAWVLRRNGDGSWRRAIFIYAIGTCDELYAPEDIGLDLDLCVPSDGLLRRVGAQQLTRLHRSPWSRAEERWLACAWHPRTRTIAKCEYEWRRGSRFIGGAFHVDRTRRDLGSSHWRARSYDKVQRPCAIAASRTLTKVALERRSLESDGALQCDEVRRSALLVPRIDRMVEAADRHRLPVAFRLTLVPLANGQEFEKRTRLSCRSSANGQVVVTCSNGLGHGFRYAFHTSAN